MKTFSNETSERYALALFELATENSEIDEMETLEQWLTESGFQEVKTVDITATTPEEQRTTLWMNFESLSDFLDPKDPQKTIEGYPAPLRAIVIAKK